MCNIHKFYMCFCAIILRPVCIMLVFLDFSWFIWKGNWYVFSMIFKDVQRCSKFIHWCGMMFHWCFIDFHWFPLILHRFSLIVHVPWGSWAFSWGSWAYPWGSRTPRDHETSMKINANQRKFIDKSLKIFENHWKYQGVPWGTPFWGPLASAPWINRF